MTWFLSYRNIKYCMKLVRKVIFTAFDFSCSLRSCEKHRVRKIITINASDIMYYFSEDGIDMRNMRNYNCIILQRRFKRSWGNTGLLNWTIRTNQLGKIIRFIRTFRQFPIVSISSYKRSNLLRKCYKSWWRQ